MLLLVLLVAKKIYTKKGKNLRDPRHDMRESNDSLMQRRQSLNVEIATPLSPRKCSEIHNRE